jgi:uncharacterized DUF497 family protein
MDYDFDWDDTNEQKLLLRHFVRADEVEEVFYGKPSVKTLGEEAYVAIGPTDAGRWLLIVFVRREGRIRPYSARDLTDREKRRFKR